jgi:LEA14-like dessication related protein
MAEKVFARMPSRLLLAGLVLVGLVLVESCQSYQAPQFRRIENLKVAHFDFSHPLVTADVIYYNPNGIGFDFKGANLDIYLDSLWLGHTVIDTSVHVSPHSEFDIVLPLQLDLQRLIQSGLQTYLNRKVNVRVEGMVHGSKAGIPKKFPIHYEGEQELNLKLF